MLTAFPDLPNDVKLLQSVYTEEVERTWITMLSQEEIERRNSFGHEGRKQGFTLGRVALRTLLARELAITPNDVVIEIQASGQLVSPGSNLFVSLAHSGNKAIAAASTGPLGIDVEEVRPKPSDLFDYILADDERDQAKSLSAPEPHRLFLYWTLKEAVLKAQGIGLRSSPRSVVVRLDEPQHRATMTDLNGKEWQGRYCIQGTWISAIAF